MEPPLEGQETELLAWLFCVENVSDLRPKDGFVRIGSRVAHTLVDGVE